MDAHYQYILYGNGEHMYMLTEKDITARLIDARALFHKIHVIMQRFDVIPSDKNHIGAYIEYTDLQEMREEFLSELLNSIVDWVYSSEKYKKLHQQAIEAGRSPGSAASEIYRKAKTKFRGNNQAEPLVSQGQFGELLLFEFIQRFMKAVPLLRKMPITTSTKHERFGADAIHFKLEGNRPVIVLGEAKTYTKKYGFSEAFYNSINSILDTYEKHRKEIDLYVHEDFLDKEMDEIAESYLEGTLKNIRIDLVCIITYNENKKIEKTEEKKIRNQIERIIDERYGSIDKSKINLEKNPILSRITYIVFPVWELEKLIEEFQNQLQ